MITQTNFYKEKKDDILSGLIYGLVFGLVSGLVSGLVFGLVSGLVVILINFSEALPFFSIFPNWLFLIIGIIILAEIMFWLSKKEKVKKKDLFWHTCKKKFENIFEVLLGFSLISQIYILIREGAKHYNLEVQELILNWIGYIGIGILGIGLIFLVFYLWIKLNSLKYKK